LKHNVKHLCRDYLEGFGSRATSLVYHHRLNGPKAVDALESPAEIAKRRVRGKAMPYGYGSGIQDVALENGHFLFALCDAYEATGDEFFAETAKHIFAGMKLVATVSPVPGFVPRGPHPDGHSYYPNSSMDQHTTFVYALWRYYRSSLATDEDKRFIADVLDKVARRMEQYGWEIRVEDGSQRAHVGFCWLQFTRTGATVLLAVLGAVSDVTGDRHWHELYEQLGTEQDGLRWKLLSADSDARRPPLTLYSNQFPVGLAVLTGAEKDVARQEQLREYRRLAAERMLRSNVFDENQWRRLDWADNWTEQETEQLLTPFGLSLHKLATVFDIYQRFDPQFWASKNWKLRTINGKLCFGIPTVAFHAALLSEDAGLIQEVAPHVTDMVEKMLAHGHRYTHGENFNRSVVLGLHLLAVEKP